MKKTETVTYYEVGFTQKQFPFTGCFKIASTLEAANMLYGTLKTQRTDVKPTIVKVTLVREEIR